MAEPGGNATADAQSAFKDVLPHILRTLRREPALAITVCYLLVAMAGIFYNYAYYRQFGIPVLTLSQISDFLVAGIQQPVAIALVLSTFPLCWLFDRINLILHRRHLARSAPLRESQQLSRWQRWRLQAQDAVYRTSWLTQLSNLLVVFLYGWVFVTLYARHHADAIKHGQGVPVRVWLAGQADPLPAREGSLTYLGAISNFVFVFDNQDHQASILPVNAITRIEPARAPMDPPAP